MVILTYNIRGGRGTDDRLSLARAADVVRASKADIACLQEVEQWLKRSRFADQPKWLGERLGMEFVYQRNVALRPGGFGSLLLSRFTVLETRAHSLTSQREQRGVMEVTVSAPFGPLSVFCTHWGLDSQERLLQARETAAIVNASPNPRVLCGDLNESDDAPAVQALLSESSLHDLAVEAGSPLPTFPSDSPTARLDYILASEEFRAITSSVMEGPASDHRAVVVHV